MAHRIRAGDLVQVIAGDDAGKQGRVLSVDREQRRLRIEKVRMQKRHLKPGRSGAPSRIRIQTQDDRKVRVFAKGGALVPDPGVQG